MMVEVIRQIYNLHDMIRKNDIFFSEFDWK